MGTKVDCPTIARLRERLAERAEFATQQRRAHLTPTMQWSDCAYWTGAQDGYTLALAALDALSAAESESC